MTKINIIHNCFACSYNSYDRMEGGYDCFKIRKENGEPKSICWSEEDLETDFPEWCPLEDYKENVNV